MNDNQSGGIIFGSQPDDSLNPTNVFETSSHVGNPVNEASISQVEANNSAVILNPVEIHSTDNVSTVNPTDIPTTNTINAVNPADITDNSNILVPNIPSLDSNVYQETIKMNDSLDSVVNPSLNGNEIPNTNQSILEFDLPSSGNNTNNALSSLDVNLNSTEQNSSTSVAGGEVLISNNVVSNESDNNSAEIQNSDVISVSKYLGHMFLFSIPIVGIIMLFIKAFSKSDKGISNFAKAILICSGIFILVFGILFGVIFGVNSLNS